MIISGVPELSKVAPKITFLSDVLDVLSLRALRKMLLAMFLPEANLLVEVANGLNDAAADMRWASASATACMLPLAMVIGLTV